MTTAIALALCHHRHAIEWQHGRSKPCHDCEVLAQVVERVVVQEVQSA